MKKRFLTVALLLLVGIACGTGLIDAFAQAQRTSPQTTIADKRGESERERLAQAPQASLTPAERLAGGRFKSALIECLMAKRRKT
jgi:hypothetical protein